jgi:hypothetical protein
MNTTIFLSRSKNSCVPFDDGFQEFPPGDERFIPVDQLKKITKDYRWNALTH